MATSRPNREMPFYDQGVINNRKRAITDDERPEPLTQVAKLHRGHFPPKRPKREPVAETNPPRCSELPRRLPAQRLHQIAPVQAITQIQTGDDTSYPLTTLKNRHGSLTRLVQSDRRLAEIQEYKTWQRNHAQGAGEIPDQRQS
jgi:hypothetical protein